MAAAIWVREADVVICEGEQASWYLNGQLSANVDSLEPGGGRRALLLNPDGSLVAPLGVIKIDAEVCRIHVPVGSSIAVIHRLERFRLRTKVSFSARPGSTISYSCFSKGECTALEEAVRLKVPGVMAAETFTMGDVEVGEMYCELGREAVERMLSDFTSLDRTEFSRIRSGQPQWSAECMDGMNPTELGEAFVRSRTDFGKGCYTGQELIARIDSRGYKTPRRLSGFIVSGEPSKLATFREGMLGDNSRPVFSITSYYFDGRFACGIGLGFSHRSGGEFRTEILTEHLVVRAVGLEELSRIVEECV